MIVDVIIDMRACALRAGLSEPFSIELATTEDGDRLKAELLVNGTKLHELRYGQSQYHCGLWIVGVHVTWPR